MFVNGTPADFYGGQGLTTRRRLVIPFTLTLLWAALLEAARLLGRLLRWTLTHPATSAAVAVLVAAFWTGGLARVVLVLALTAAALGVWFWLRPESFDRRVTQHLRGIRRWQVRYRRLWYPALDGVGLTRKTRDDRMSGGVSGAGGQVVYVPQVTAVRSTRVVDTIHVRLLHGHTPEDLAKEAEGLRHAFGAHRVAVIEDGPGRVHLNVYATDPLTAPITARVPDLNPADPADLDRLAEFLDVAWLHGMPVGMSEAGTVYRLGLRGTHVLVAGATGSGKGSVLWSLMLALAPAIRAGLVNVTGIDPKGGMELYPGRALFTHYADENPEAMARALDDAVVRMLARKDRLRGVARDHTPSVVEPFEVIVVDELAFLTAYLTDRKLKDQIKASLSILLSQGRALGFVVVAALQDPRKDVLSFRDLFPTRIALRVTEDSHVDMVLGDGALDRGAAAHRIPDTLPGVGFVWVEGSAEPIRVRFSYVTDDDIDLLVRRWPAPANVDQVADVIDLRPYDRPTGDSEIPAPRISPAIESGDDASERENRAEGGE